jgi:asparagine synthase (glutamine-hydrolysing)
MQSEDGRVVLVFNGEIYNFTELRADLESRGHRFVGRSDTEVLLRLYLEFRTGTSAISDMLGRLNGIFAFAIWDADREALLLARDALGVKPLYYSCTENGFWFGSEMKALPPSAQSLDICALDRYLTFLWCPGDATPAAQTRKLEPGCALWVRDGVIQERLTWYRLPMFSGVGSGPTHSPALTREQAIAGVEHHLRQAVHRQMAADVPVGAFLSGGLDSSSIVAFARERDPTIRCFTIEAVGLEQEGMSDDLPYARAVAHHLQVPLEVVRIDAARMADDLPMMVAQLDEPLADLAALNTLYISRLARDQGIKVLLSGTGGDDLLTGYRRHQAVWGERAWSWLPRPVRAGLGSLVQDVDPTRPLLRRIRKMFQGAALEGDRRLVNYFRWVDRSDLSAIYSPAFRDALGQAQAEQPMLDFLAQLPAGTPRMQRMLGLEQRFFLADHNLTYTDKMSMAAGVEVRVPFLDLDFVAFADRIPLRWKHRGTEVKWVLKKAMEPYLPRHVIYRPKSGFAAPLRRWMRGELREFVGDILSEKNLRERGLFDPIAVRALISANGRGEIDASYLLLSLVCIELWCKNFRDLVNT